MKQKAENSFWIEKKDKYGPNRDIVLLDNVQFIYELLLAEMEIKALGVDYEVINGLREFRILEATEEKKN